ncbi:hypothetical protein HQN90_09090 [Paenibacillus alba]|uniref:hypothetical protein n=1 Tax=Paenibacillus alba TaxID=1197127 RepID=UPI00156466F8|nr:hypothetical protein [Paenibacillus alba]NQX66280.1 hypothetical protein [Paenibacillus alba]
MNRKKRAIILLVSTFSLVSIGFLGVKWLQDNIFCQFQSFSVTINNKSDFDIVSVETGIIKDTSKDIRTTKIKSGETMKIKPALTLTGEGAIYIKYIDSRGDAKEKTICGYTESLLGNSRVTISNDKVSVEERCT